MQIVRQVFLFQAKHCEVYRRYIELLDIKPETVSTVEEIPFLPIEFFKTHKVASTDEAAKIVFTSSSTTGIGQSRHYVPDVALYEESFTRGLEYFYGRARDYCFLALLPSYLEREGSSLVYMAKHLMEQSGHPSNGFYLDNQDELLNTLMKNEASGTKTVLIGVSFALLDFAEKYALPLKNTIIMETGGMKGRRKEITRAELHSVIKNSFSVPAIHSEYGMTELLSQAYSRSEGFFHCPPWMKVLVRETDDPFSYCQTGKTGAVNVIDLANLGSCSFIATSDLGRTHADGSFEILGRMDNSDIRGCNVMVG